ncbi:MAG: hypothetical protein GAK30_02997 [Paracidovorax wautersii]|uniref:Type IV pilus assembly protein PilX n=1 Tax=Paracidovorax wautersii TaxID=1177982 RepID=A0A7V8FLY3_9BURK|nr:MAG: hypothetical protein GAK30_02997 [Paracidovorax wautersii]
MTLPAPAPPTLRLPPQTGLSLITVLMLLAAASLLALAAAQAGLMAERGARHDQDSQIAWEAAEAALADAERDIESTPPNGRANLLRAGADSFAPDCGGSGDRRGLCRASDQGQPAWQRVDLARAAAPAVDYGTFTGRHLDTGTAASTRVYRITALGFGPRTQTQIVLQTVYRARSIDAANAAADDHDANLPRGRLSWRHLPNYRQWHGALPES